MFIPDDPMLSRRTSRAVMQCVVVGEHPRGQQQIIITHITVGFSPWVSVAGDLCSLWDGLMNSAPILGDYI